MAGGFKAMGHEVAYFAFWGLQGGKVRAEDYLVLPPAFNPWGSDIVKAHKEHFRADVVITHWDIWVVDSGFVEQAYPWCPYFPIDQYPVPPRVIARAKECYQPIVYSQFALRVMREAGIECAFVPHGVDIEIFKPLDKMECRRRLGFPEDAFVIGLVAANKGYPSRKAIPEALLAFEKFRGRHSDAMLYLHMHPGRDDAGVDVHAILNTLDLPPGSVKMVDEYHYICGLPDEYMADAYNSFNVLHAASMGEGLGLPILESQACGTRVVTTDCSSMPEITFDGIVTRPAQRFWTELDSWAVMPSVENMLEAWERIYTGELGDPFAHSQKAVEGARQYRWEVVLEEHWKPFLEDLERRLGEDKEPIHVPALGPEAACGEAEEIHLNGQAVGCEAGDHQWAGVGLYEGNVLCVPCLRGNCPAELRIAPTGCQTVNSTGFGMETDGIALDIEDDPDGGVAKIVYREIESSYDLASIPFEPGDVVLDLGAHVGVVSLYIAKRYPEVTVYAFEPVPANILRLRQNREANDAMNVVIVNCAVTADGRELTLWGKLGENSGGASALVPGGGDEYAVPSMTLEEIFERFVPERCKLLKIDVEGMEYEVLDASNDLLKRVDYLAIETHMNETLAGKRHTVNGLKALCASYIPAERLRVCAAQLAEGVNPRGG